MNIHCIGIGGIGLSALAQYYLKQGYRVSGSDKTASEMTAYLRKKGARVFIGEHKAKHVPQDAELILYSPAVQKNNPELTYAKKLNIKTLSYPEALGELTKSHYTVAVSGTHGKSTTTAMLALICVKAKLDPTVIVGTKLKEFKNTNCRIGKKIFKKGKPLLIIEADEHFASFLNYSPDIIILTSIGKDHLDFYKTLSNILKTFKQYVSLLSKDGVLIANKDDENTRKIAKGRKVRWYSLRQKDARKIQYLLHVPGKHNVSNALAALTGARALNIPDAASFQALSEFKGTWRRFEIFQLPRYTLISDYGHHPTEIEATLRAVRKKWPQNKIWLVFQPHQYDRTHRLFQDFVRVLKRAPIDRIILTNIYDVAGREEKGIQSKVSCMKLAEAVNKTTVECVPSFLSIISKLKKNLHKKDVIIVMGAGDIYDKLTVKLTNKKG